MNRIVRLDLLYLVLYLRQVARSSHPVRLGDVSRLRVKLLEPSAEAPLPPARRDTIVHTLRCGRHMVDVRIVMMPAIRRRQRKWGGRNSSQPIGGGVWEAGVAYPLP